ncbi:MAG: transposase [Dehalococcoidia bacterium]
MWIPWGLLLAVVVHAAHISDSRGVRLLVLRLWCQFPHLQKIWVDAGYKRGCVEWAEAMFGYLLEVVKRTDQGFNVLLKRWIVERTFAWLSFHRRLNRDYEHNPKSSETNIKIAMITFMLNRLVHSPYPFPNRLLEQFL